MSDSSEDGNFGFKPVRGFGPAAAGGEPAVAAAPAAVAPAAVAPRFAGVKIVRESGFGRGGPVVIRPSVGAPVTRPAPVAAEKKGVRFAPGVGGTAEAEVALKVEELEPAAAGGGGGAAEAPVAKKTAPVTEADAAAMTAQLTYTRLRKGKHCEAPRFMDALTAGTATTELIEDDASFKSSGDQDAATAAIAAKPIDLPARDVVYAPVISAQFPKFILNTFRNYSPLVAAYQELVKSGKKPAEAFDELTRRELDQEACKNRDPNKVETFYYQKLVRDYLNNGSPYRGLLIYHGLGTGKTCTSVAAAEALYWGGKKTIFILTPATLSANYRKELGKCGYFPFRRYNHWAFLTSSPLADQWLTDVLGLTPEIVKRQGGGWVPNPAKPSNWDTLSAPDRAAILAQQEAHMECRFKIIHYTGIMPQELARAAFGGVVAGKSLFDDAVVVIDEVHNLVRTINGTMIGGRKVPQIMTDIEPREFSWTAPLARARPDFRYPRGYSFDRLLQNAVDTKIIALSATPMINYAQEMAILANIVGGEQRLVELSLARMARDPSTLKRLEAWCVDQPDIDFYAVEENQRRETVLNVTPVPHGFAKVLAADGKTRGFVRLPAKQVPGLRAPSVEESNERNLDRWAAGLVKRLETATILPAGAGAEAETAVAAARAAGPGTVPKTSAFVLHVMPLLPEDPNTFVETFVDRMTLKLKNSNVLRARMSGLVSYYRGGSEELMPRVGKNEIVNVEMSEYMFGAYAKARGRELEMEAPAKQQAPAAAAAGGKGAGDIDLYTLATKTQQTGFLALSRAACNFAFPEDVPRPDVNVKDQVKLLGAQQDTLIAADIAVDADTDLSVARRGAAAAAGGGDEEGEAPGAEAEAEAGEPKEEPLSAALQGIIGTLMSGLEAKADEYLNKGLVQFSPKYAAILERIRQSPGPALVYSQFKTLEGLGIFAAVLRAAPEQYLPLDIQRNAAGEWEIPAPLMDPATLARPRYIVYSGDQELEKRRYLLQLFNADVAGLPPKLSAQCATLLAGAPDNRDGRVCRVFMITQSGAEGISLFNTRQVHIMEPYWNNVRIQQVIGRAIRLCSHMNLPWDDRVVDIYTYRSVFSAAQKAGTGSKQIIMADKGFTTDEVIFDIAQKKQTLADALAEIAQSAAIDCFVHSIEHRRSIACFTYPDKGHPGFMYHPDWQKDIAAASAKAGK